MTLLLYAIASADQAQTAARRAGIDAVPFRRLAALVAALPPRLDADEETLRAYERTIESLMGDETVLPARFGSVLADETEVRGLLRSRYDELTALLRQVTGAVEIGIRAHPPHPRRRGTDSGAPPATGTDYLRARLELRRRSEALADAIDARVAGLYRSRTRRLPDEPGRALTASYLVPRSGVPEFAERCARPVAGVSLVCTGPWPPYSFSAGAAG